MTDPSILSYTIGFPLLVLLLTCATRYPMKSEIPDEQDRKLALIRYGADIGLDCYFCGAVAVVSATIGRYGSSVPSSVVLVMLVYVVFSVLIGRLYKVDWKKTKNHCLTVGMVAMILAILYALIIFFLA